MDARERLRLYLEQRRELGESELVLDALPVDDALALLGARTRGASPPGARAVSAPRGPQRAARTGSGEPSADDRPAAASDGPLAEGAGTAAPEATGADTGNPPPVLPPPAPPVPRFDATATSRDWRAQLQAATGETRPPAAPSAPSTPSAPAAPAAPSAPAASSTPAPAAPSEALAATTAPAESSAGAPAAPSAGGPPAPAWLTALGVPLGLDVGRTLVAPPSGTSLADIERAIAGCAACALGASALHHVPGEGNPVADFVCVGEAPGQTEDETGRPFVGAAGQLLTKILGAIQFAREDVFICNVLKHRPPGNRTPTPDEVRACRPFLEQQLALVQPRVILALGTSAAHALLETTQALGALRGRIHRYHGIPVVVTYHPAALLRNEAWKRPTWEDVRLARRIHDAARAASPS